MIGIDTSFLVAFEVASHPLHQPARALARQHATDGFALAPQVLAEFVHVVTDPQRFSKPLAVTDAVDRASRWWNAAEVRQVHPSSEATSLFLDWMAELGLGRKRLLDTMLAATYKSAGVAMIASTNFRDSAALPGVHALAPGSATPPQL